MTQVQEAALLFFRSALSLTGQAEPDLELAYLTSLGYTVGSIDDRWQALADAEGVGLQGFSSFTIRDMVVSGAIVIGP